MTLPRPRPFPVPLVPDAALRMEDLRGVWRRSLLRWPDGRKDTTTRVNWLQGLRTFGDLRQPPTTPPISAGCLRDLSLADLLRLADQEAFAGDLAMDGAFFVWLRRVDFQPQSPTPDAGTLRMEGDRMVEEGRHVPYIEHWHREHAAAEPVAAAWLTEQGTAVRGMILRVGSSFAYARGRRVTLPPGTDLAECIRGASTLSTAQDLADCEISLGTVNDGSWRITASTLPFKVHQALLPERCEGGTARFLTADLSPEGDPIRRQWQIDSSEGGLNALHLSHSASE